MLKLSGNGNECKPLAVGKIPMNVEDMKIDCMSISGHKIYGPKGIGAIYIRRRPRVRMEALISGGGQERGLRSGRAYTRPFLSST
jgi:cysteine desulfurase